LIVFLLIFSSVFVFIFHFVLLFFNVFVLPSGVIKNDYKMVFNGTLITAYTK